MVKIKKNMEENINWNLSSNTELKEKIESLEKEFAEKQAELKTIVQRVEELNNSMVELSKEYNKIVEILNKREGRA